MAAEAFTTKLLHVSNFSGDNSKLLDPFIKQLEQAQTTLAISNEQLATVAVLKLEYYISFTTKEK